MAQGHSVDEYLETIYFLAFPIGEYRPYATGSPTLSTRVAEMLGVSRASAGEMLKRLEAEGLIERGEHKEAMLTAVRPRARRAGRPQAPDHRADAHRLHGLHGRRGARARGRARRHVHRRHGRADRRAARPSRPLPARLAGRHRRSSRPRTTSSRRSPTSQRRRRARRSSASPSTTASSCTGSTTRASSRAASSRSRRAAGRRPDHGPAGRRRARDRRQGRRRPLRPAGLVVARTGRDRRGPRRTGPAPLARCDRRAINACSGVRDRSPRRCPAPCRAVYASRRCASWTCAATCDDGRRRLAGPARRRRRARVEAGGRAQRVRLVRALPGEVVVVAAEVAVRGRLRVDRAAQVEVAQDRRRTQVEVLAHELLDPLAASGRTARCRSVSTCIETGCATPIA